MFKVSVDRVYVTILCEDLYGGRHDFYCDESEFMKDFYIRILKKNLPQKGSRNVIVNPQLY